MTTVTGPSVGHDLDRLTRVLARIASALAAAMAMKSAW